MRSARADRARAQRRPPPWRAGPSPIAQVRRVAGDRPQAAAQAEAAITLLSAIQAKFVTYEDAAPGRRPRCVPAAARAAITEGTPSREPTGARAATSAEPSDACPPAMRTRASRTLKAGTQAGPA